MKFSIVIPAHNEEKEIGAAVKSLAKLSYPRDEFEIIVVDNDSTDGTYEAAKKAGADRVILETKKGTNFAREAGRREAEGRIVAFLDADSRAPLYWLRQIEADLKRQGVVAVSGPYDYGFRGLKRSLDSFYSRFIIPLAPKILHLFFRKKAGVMIGGNFAGYNWAFEKIGGLPPLAFWGDDVAIAMMVARRAGKVLFDPDLKVMSSPRRFEKEGFLKIVSRYIREYVRIYFSKDFR